MTHLARLRALRRQAGATPSCGPPLPMDATTAIATPGACAPLCRPADAAKGKADGAAELQRRVASLRGLLGRREALRLPPGLDASSSRAPIGDRIPPGIEVAAGVHLIQCSYAPPPMPDAIHIAALRSLPQQRHARRHDPDGDQFVSGSRLLAIDTETTGLAGGTGTRAFMIGVADLDGDRLRVRQLLTTTMGGEAAMLRMFAAWLRPDHVLVSYNGRSYDRPLLSTRLRLARLQDPLAGMPHLDLLHVTRRAYRRVWQNCRLATAERELLGVVRDDDLPGSEAPAAWLGYLRGGSSHALHRVAAHNDQDLRSLMGLVAHFATFTGSPVHGK